MEIKETIAKLEKRYNKKISWYMISPFYADSNGTISEEDVLLFNMETSFYCYSETVDSNFEAINVLAIEHARKTNAISYAKGETNKLRCLGSIPSLFTESVDVIELEDDKVIFLKLKGTEFKQMLKIAASKQKYSREEYLRSKKDF